MLRSAAALSTSHVVFLQIILAPASAKDTDDFEIALSFSFPFAFVPTAHSHCSLILQY